MVRQMIFKRKGAIWGTHRALKIDEISTGICSMPGEQNQASEVDAGAILGHIYKVSFGGKVLLIRSS